LFKIGDPPARLSDQHYLEGSWNHKRRISDIKKVNRRCAKNKVQLEAQQSRPTLSQDTGKGEFDDFPPPQRFDDCLPSINSKAIFLLRNLYNNLPLSFPKGPLKCKTGDWKHSVWFLGGERSRFQDTLILWPTNWIPSVRHLNLKDAAARRVVNTNLATHCSYFSGI